jgi:1-aminocyclopropane-1-carboxylate deaminase
MTKMLFDTSACLIQPLHSPWMDHYGVQVSVLRLDLLHPVVSGNKLFKLHYFLQEEAARSSSCLLTFGGAYSNHLVATACAAHLLNKKSTGIVRGEEPKVLSPTLQHCLAYGMQLEFVTRDEYRHLQTPGMESLLSKRYGEGIIIPEGGYHPLGAKGAQLICELIDPHMYSHVATATGTATTLAGLLMGCAEQVRVHAYEVLKGMSDLPQRIHYLAGNDTLLKKMEIAGDYHFGGYARHTPELISFMNACWEEFRLPLDFVYTAKMLYGVFEDTRQRKYPEGSHILCLHTGGLQGNRSLLQGTLRY